MSDVKNYVDHGKIIFLPDAIACGIGVAGVTRVLMEKGDEPATQFEKTMGSLSAGFLVGTMLFIAFGPDRKSKRYI